MTKRDALRSVESGGSGNCRDSAPRPSLAAPHLFEKWCKGEVMQKLVQIGAAGSAGENGCGAHRFFANLMGNYARVRLNWSFITGGNQVAVICPRRPDLVSVKPVRFGRRTLAGRERDGGESRVDVVAAGFAAYAAVGGGLEGDVAVGVENVLADFAVVVGIGLGEIEGLGFVGGHGDAAGFAVVSGVFVGHQGEVGDVAVVVHLVAGGGAVGRGVGVAQMRAVGE